MHCRAVDGGVAATGGIGAIGGHGADLLAVRDLVEQVRQHRAVTFTAGGELHRPDVRLGYVHGQMSLAPSHSLQANHCQATTDGGPEYHAFWPATRRRQRT